VVGDRRGGICLAGVEMSDGSGCNRSAGIWSRGRSGPLGQIQRQSWCRSVGQPFPLRFERYCAGHPMTPLSGRETWVFRRKAFLISEFHRPLPLSRGPDVSPCGAARGEHHVPTDLYRPQSEKWLPATGRGMHVIGGKTETV
jgi:hypothetical protein